MINLTLSAGPEINEHLVYALLERHALFEPLRVLPECVNASRRCCCAHSLGMSPL